MIGSGYAEDIVYVERRALHWCQGIVKVVPPKDVQPTKGEVSFERTDPFLVKKIEMRRF